MTDRSILVAGQKVDHLRNTRHEAGRASKLLSQARGRTVPVTGALVFVATEQITIRSRPLDVLISTEGSIVRALKKLKPQMHPDQVAAIVDVAVRDRTWSSKPAAPVQPGLLAEFAELVCMENVARWIRVAWVLTAFAVLLGAIAPLVMSVFARILQI